MAPLIAIGPDACQLLDDAEVAGVAALGKLQHKNSHPHWCELRPEAGPT